MANAFILTLRHQHRYNVEYWLHDNATLTQCCHNFVCFLRQCRSQPMENQSSKILEKKQTYFQKNQFTGILNRLQKIEGNAKLHNFLKIRRSKAL